MSDETAQRPAEAQAHQAEQVAIVDRMKHEVLNETAEGIAARLDEVAKNIALAQPDVTKKLGASGLSKMRKEVAFNAEALAYEIRGGL
jgi:hypothetical protein